jgi:hypothetical protein
MAPSIIHRPQTLRISAMALAALSLTCVPVPASAQTVYREYDDGRVDVFPRDGRFAAPYRRQPRADDEDDDGRFEREEDNDDDGYDDDDNSENRQGTFDFSRQEDSQQPLSRKAPAPPPSVEARPGDEAWKPAL